MVRVLLFLLFFTLSCQTAPKSGYQDQRCPAADLSCLPNLAKLNKLAEISKKFQRLETDRLDLLPFSPQDSEAVFDLLNDPFTATMNGGAPSREILRELEKKPIAVDLKSGRFQWVLLTIKDKENHDLIGDISLTGEPPKYLE